MLLTGNYRRNLDDKLRVAIPKQLRDGIGFPDRSTLFIAPGTDHSLSIYTCEVLERMGSLIESSSPAARDTRAFSRLFYAQAQPADIDKQGRLRIPPELATLAGLASEVVVLGVRDRIEIWNSSNWDQFLAQTQPNYDQLAETVLGNTEIKPN
ncbi:MAG: cell division protein [Planctomycetales bacterium]|nr:cell division protein [Planctomycetales bacterium]